MAPRRGLGTPATFDRALKAEVLKYADVIP
jgi:hypothetical protein